MLVLASQSPSRVQLLRAAGLVFDSQSPEVDESLLRSPSPARLAAQRASAKALAVLPLRPEGDLILGADQVVHLGRQVFHKPATEERHLRMLQTLRGKEHSLVTAVALRRTGPAGLERQDLLVRSRLRMRALTDEEVRGYVASGEGRWCAGGYQVESLGLSLFSTIHGDWTNILGLPMLSLLEALRAWGVNPLQPRG